ncbi:MAG: beta-ketoacyl synthase N-terminal-like domain-containing protein, partial [Bacteroidota bacterium]|nr:beta-ketoacyl synthase N-terminal-like domain-containing protein [Bacteroidota bacterium]
MKNNRVVITGMGIVSPIGNGMSSFENALFAGYTGTRYIQELKNYGFSCQVAGVPNISDHPKLDFLKKYGLLKTSLLLQYAVLAGLDAWENAKLSIPENHEQPADFDNGCIIGAGIGPLDLVVDNLIPNTNKVKKRKLRSTIVEQSMLNAPSAHLSMILGLGNQVSFNSAACATGTEAIITAAERIATGKAKRMLAGGTESYSPHGWIGFDVMRVLNRNMNDNPEKASCPLSENAAGFIPGAGAGVLLLESLESALERNAPILAEISGTHINSGGQRNGGTMTAPSSEAVIKCVQESIKDAEIQASDIDYINGHLSSTMADVLEIQNLSKALNRYGKDFPYINSLKAQTGHCIGAGGAIETIASVLQIQSQKVAASINSKALHPEIAKLIDEKCVPDKP